MSFADRVRQELSAIAPKHNCCRRALTEGLLLGATLAEDGSVFARFGHEDTAMLAQELLFKQYGKQPSVRKWGKCGHSYWDVSISVPACRRFVRSMDDADSDGTAFHLSCESCQGAFLRGAFLSVATVNDPHKAFHIEFKLLPQRVKLFTAFLEELGYPPKEISRSGMSGVYYKNGSAVEDLITLMGAGHVLFEVINSRIEREIRNNENRATNCVARNIEKTIAAATKQIEAINRLVETGKLMSLPVGLQETARLRYENPDASLDELVSLHSPAISRSGLNHRLKKIVDAAEDL